MSVILTWEISSDRRESSILQFPYKNGHLQTGALLGGVPPPLPKFVSVKCRLCRPKREGGKGRRGKASREINEKGEEQREKERKGEIERKIS